MKQITMISGNVILLIFFNIEILEIFFTVFLLATAYSATIGGLASLVGTAPNALVKGFVEKYIRQKIFPLSLLPILYSVHTKTPIFV